MFTIRPSRGQGAVEYLVFFAVIAVLTLLSLCAFYPRIHQASQTAFQKAIEDIAK